MKKFKIAFYVSTVLLSLSMLLSAYFELSMAQPAVEVLKHLGYPDYFNYILGTAKILGVIGIWQSRVYFIREWAYAGFFFDLFAAIYSHSQSGDPISMMMPAIINLLILIVSYVSFKQLNTKSVK